MAKKLLFMLTVVLVASIFAIGTFAATTKAYVKSGATGDGLTSSTPIGSISNAFKLFGADGGTIYIIGEYPITSGTTIPEKKFDYTLKGLSGGCISMSANLALAQNTNDNTVTFDLPLKLSGGGNLILFGGFNSIVFGSNFSVSSSDGTALNFYGGMRSGTVEAITELPYSIVVNTGTFNVFSGGNFRDSISAYVGSIAAPVSITIKGGTFGKSGTYSTASNNKNYDTFSVSGMSILADDATLNISGGTFYHPIYVQGRLGTVSGEASAKSKVVKKNKKYYAIDGDIKVNISGGTFKGGAVSAYYTQAGYTTVMRGNYTVKVTGGTFASGTVFDATQVKGYSGSTTKATITYPTSKSIKPVRFDVVNGAKKTYTDPIRVVFIGDSITEGYAASAAGVDRLTESYPAKFLKYAEAAGREVIVGNFGVSASGFHPATKRFYNNMLSWPMVSEESAPDYVFVAIGINDAETIGGTNGAFTTFKSNFSGAIKKMGNLPDTDKVFVANAIYCSVGDVQMHRAAAVLRPTQEILAKDLVAIDSGKYHFVDFFGLTLDAALNDSLFRADNGTIYERLHPATAGLDLMGKTMYKAAFGGVTKPSAAYKKTTVYVSDSGTARGAGTAASPISDLSYAYSLLDLNKDCTIYIVGTVSLGFNLHTPVSTKKVTFAGSGSNAVLRIGGTTLKIGSNVKFTNLTLAAGGSALSIHGCYKNVEITSTVKTSGVCHFHAGFNVFSTLDASKDTIHDSVSSASTGRNCTIKINGGKYRNFTLGNARYASDAPIGTYSGTINATIGSGVTIGDSSSTYVGIVGHNYLTGTINVTVNGWGSGKIYEYSKVGSRTSAISYDTDKNTGVVNFTLASGLSNKVVYAAVKPSIRYEGGKVTLTWTENSLADRYRIFRRVSGESTWDGVARYTANTSYTDTTVVAGTEYEYAVQAWVKLGSEYHYSDTHLVSIIAKNLPTPTIKVKNTTAGVSLTASAVTGAEGYKFYRSTDGKTFAQIGKVTTTTFTDTTAVSGKTYYYTVRAYTQSKGIRYSNDAASESIVALASVSLAIYYDIDAVHITWDAVDNADRYRIFRRVAGESAWDGVSRYVATASYRDTTAAGDTEYEYAVQSWVLNNGEYCYGPLKVTAFKTKVLNTPTVTVKNTTAGVSITTSAVADAEGYKFYRSTDGESFTQIAKTTDKTYVDTTAKVGATYYYQVRAYTTDGGVSYSHASESKAIERIYPIEFTLYYDGDAVNITWDAVEDADKYRVFRRKTGESAWDSVTRMTAVAKYVDSTAEAGVSYDYSVQAWVKVGDTYCYSPMLVSSISFVQFPSPTLTASATDTAVSLSVAAVEGADGYKFYRSTDGETFKQIAKTTETTYTDTSVEYNTAYYYQVRAYKIDNTVSYSPLSASVPVISLAPVMPEIGYDGEAVCISWSESNVGSDYYIFRRISGETDFDGVTRTTAETSYRDTYIAADTTYEYAVQEKFALCGVDFYSPLEICTVTTSRLSAPELTATVSDDGAHLTVSKVSGADGYIFYRSTDGTTFEEIAKTADVSYVDITMEVGRAYSYKAVAYTSGGFVTSYSEDSEPCIVSTALSGVPTLALTSSDSGIVLTSSEIVGATGYVFYRSEDGITFSELATASKNSYTDTPADEKTEYYYKVRACRVGAIATTYSAYSEVVVSESGFAYTETSGGAKYDKIAERADGTEFTLLVKKQESGMSIELKEVPSGEYIYCVYGDFILQGVVLDREALVATVPYANADAIVFASEPIVNYGDANADGHISLIDALRTLKYSVGVAADIDVAAANVNGDIELSVADILGILKITVSQSDVY